MFDIFSTVFKYKEKSSPDKLGAYPEKVHVGAMPERRYLWSSRILVIAAIFSICFNMMLASTIYLLLPLKKAAPRLFYLNPRYNQMDILQPSEINVPLYTLVSEEQVQNYIYYRYLVSSRYDELAARWAIGGPVYWMSAPPVFRDFTDLEAKNTKILQRLKGLQRKVEIDWIHEIAQNVWQVQFKTLDYYRDKREPDVTIWRATLRISYANIEFPDKNFAMRNPFGFLVMSYSLAFHGKDTSSEHYLVEAKKTARRRNRSRR